MTSKRILGSLAILLVLCLFSTTAFTDDTKARECALADNGAAMLKATPMRTTVPGISPIECGDCFYNRWNNYVRACCQTVDGVRNCTTEPCQRPPDDVLK